MQLGALGRARTQAEANRLVHTRVCSHSEGSPDAHTSSSHRCSMRPVHRRAACMTWASGPYSAGDILASRSGPTLMAPIERPSRLNPIATACCASVGALGLLLGLASCGSDPATPPFVAAGDATLAARPGTVSEPLGPGRHALGLSGQRDGFIYVPGGLDPETPAPLLVLLHGATGDADNWEGAFVLADSLGVVFLAPDSRARTWDIIHFGMYGPDVAFIDSALGHTFRRVSIDPARMGLAGFSDGASYALSLGLSNGDLFTHIVAWSPGFSAPAEARGRPRVFVSHGSGDGVLAVQNSRDQIVPKLEADGYSVRYEEFVGGHEIPPTIFRQAFDWFLQ